MANTTMVNPFSVPTTIDEWTLTASLADYSGTLTDNVYNANVMLKRFGRPEVKRMINGGNSIVPQLLRDDQNAGGFYLGADVLNNAQPNVVTPVEYKWQNAYEPITVTRDEERQNSGDAHKIIDLVASKTQSSEKAIAKRIEQAISTPTGGSGNTIDLETLVNTGNLGSIAGGTDTFWQATVTASGAFATQGLTDMTTGTYTVAAASDDDTPTVYITNKTIFQKYEQTRLPLERITNGNLEFNAGARTLTFKGIPVIYGNFIAGGLLLGLNEAYIEWTVDTMTDFVTTQFLTPTNQTVKVAYILVRYQLITTNRRRHFKLTGIT